MTTSVLRKLDYRVPQPDKRDYVFSLSEENTSQTTIPTIFQLPVNRVEDQGQRGSCTSFALTTAFENLVCIITGDKSYQASPLFNYTQSRILNSVPLTEDPGTTLRSACGNLRLAGECRESTWPYTDANFTQIPNDQAYEEAFKLSKLITYFEVKRDPPVIKYIIHELRYFILIGFRVYQSYQTLEVEKTGDIPMPSQTELQNGPVGGHACAIVGFDDTRQVYIIVNNYGTSWGQQGYGTLPYAYFEDETLLTEAKLLIPSSDFNTKYTEATAETIQTMQTTPIAVSSRFPYEILMFIFLVIILCCAIGVFFNLQSPSIYPQPVPTLIKTAINSKI